MQDLSSILQPRDPNLQKFSGSAPTSPLESENKPILEVGPILDANRIDSAVPSTSGDSPQKRPPSRARVGFAERVEYIRPLSIISSETESSMSTIRGHSVTNSFSSVVSGTPSTRMTRPSLDTVTDIDVTDRPHTSHILEPSPRRSSLPESGTPSRPRSASCASDSSVPEPRPKKRGFYFWEPRHKSPQPDSRKAYLERPANSPPRSPVILARKSLESDQDSATRDAQGANRKPRKVRSWAHSLISRKGKSKKDQRIPTPQASQDSLSMSESSESQDAQEDESGFEPNFDEDNTVTIITESLPVSPPALDMSLIKPHSPEPDVLSPVIDLDAALGPFNTPPLASNVRGARAPPRARRSMHSLVGSQVHRRTESAPELVPFDPRNLKMMQSTSMPDVFEEDDEELAEEPTTPKESSFSEPPLMEDEPSSSPMGTGVHVVDYDESAASANPFRHSIGGFGSSRRKKSEGLSISIDSPVMAQEPRPRDLSSLEAQSPTEQRRSKASDETLTPPLSALSQNDQSLIPPLRLSMQSQHHIMTPDTLSDGCGSPYFSTSQISFDTPRLGTGSTSMTDCHQVFNMAGEPGPELRRSVDDVPSLTSSRSTMTSPVVIAPGPSNLSYVHAASDFEMLPPIPHTAGSGSGSGNSVYSVRSANTEFGGHGTKRSSIASLSRFMNPFSERRGSNLHITETIRPHSEHVNMSLNGLSMSTTSLPKSPSKTKKRLSKLMGFWKGGKEKGDNRPSTSGLSVSMSMFSEKR
jgi:hypothetical protein